MVTNNVNDTYKDFIYKNYHFMISVLHLMRKNIQFYLTFSDNILIKSFEKGK